MLKKIIQLRHELHQNPELSGFESNTAKIIKSFIINNIDNKLSYKIIENIGETGLAVQIDFKEKGPRIMFRCELDALPINELNSFIYKSKIKGVSHKCGHDGHMAMVAGLIFWINKQEFNKGSIIFLFQPAEETGKGAQAVIKDKKFSQLKPDYIFALHNIPGVDFNQIIIPLNNFSATVTSMSVSLTGKECHASEPENGVNPALFLSKIIAAFSKLEKPNQNNKNFTLLTPIYMDLGKKAYGIAAGKGSLHYTIRTWSDDVMEKLQKKIIQIIDDICSEKIDYKVEWFDEFPATRNDKKCIAIIKKAAIKNNFSVTEQKLPFKFGEDFGTFSKENKVAMFGLGSGINTPALHHDDYDFPDEILNTGISMFQNIITEILH